MSAEPLRLLGDDFVFAECPRWHDGELYVSDCGAGTVHAFQEGRGWRMICRVPGNPAGLGFDPEGRLLVVSMSDRMLLRLEGGELRPVAAMGALMPGPANDMVVDGAGRAYVGNFGSDVDAGESIAATRLVRVDPDGGVSADGEELVFPNGAAISPDGGTLIVAESFAYRLTAIQIGRDGSLGRSRLWASLGDDPVAAAIEEAIAARAPIPDGIALDSEGAVWVADAKGGGASRICEGGEVIDFVSTGELATYAVALGGADGRTLFLCASPPLGHPEAEQRGCVLASRVPVPGHS